MTATAPADPVTLLGTDFRCQEASPLSGSVYIPCGAPAQFVVQTNDPLAYAMCMACADHNTRNRGARYVCQGDTYNLYNNGQLPSPATVAANIGSPDAQQTAPEPPVQSVAVQPQALAAPQFTVAQVQKIYIETKDAAEALGKKHAEEMKPFNARMDLCKSWMLNYLNEQQLDNAKTEHGNCYKSSIMSATVEQDGGWEQVLGYIFERGLTRVLDAVESGTDATEAMKLFFQEPSLSLLNRGVNKTAVKELLDQNVTVPGVNVSHMVQLGVRRS